MGGICSGIASFTSAVLDASERVTLCTVTAALTCCILFTIALVLVLGIGIGFHYCTVQSSAGSVDDDDTSGAASLRSGSQGSIPSPLRSMNKAVRRGLSFRPRLARREAPPPTPFNPLPHADTRTTLGEFGQHIRPNKLTNNLHYRDTNPLIVK